MEYKLFSGTPDCVTPEWYAGRERAPHLEQAGHRARLRKAKEFVDVAIDTLNVRSVMDLGAGDGGFLSTLDEWLEDGVVTWGYDLQPTNVDAAWTERGQAVDLLDFVADFVDVGQADLAVMTETIEHLEDPHGFLRQLRSKAEYLVASSPADETDASHYEHHLWAWDLEGYASMLEAAGWRVLRHERAAEFQVVLAKR